MPTLAVKIAVEYLRQMGQHGLPLTLKKNTGFSRRHEQVCDGTFWLGAS